MPPHVFESADEVVYASPAEGGAQTALAYAAKVLGKRATIFVAGRSQPHPRAALARRLGAKVIEIRPGYLSVVLARAREYCAATGARLAPFGFDLPEAIATIAAAARAVDYEPDEVWCASGSGTLARGLAAAWPSARFNVVAVGRELGAKDVPAGAKIHRYPRPFGTALRCADFPADPHYDAKAWALCKIGQGKGNVLFWNVTGAAK